MALTRQHSASRSPAPTVEDARTLLTARQDAVLARSRSAFLAGLDPAASADAFRTRQGALFDNLADVPLGSWTYALGTPTDGVDVDTATARYGSPALIVPVSFSYTLRGFDRVPAVHQQWFTVVDHDGHAVLAGDDDLADSGGVSWRGPWDFGPVRIRRTATSLLLAHPAEVAQLPAIQAVVDASIPVVTSVWGTDWARSVVVILPSGTAEATALVGSDLDLTNLAALSVVESADDVAGGEVQRVIMNPVQLARLSPVGRRITIQHEITHIASRPVTGDATPTWLIEGFAEYVGNLGSRQSVTLAAQELRADLRRGLVPTALPATVDFAGSSGRSAQTYQEAWLACRLIAADAGQAGLVRFYRQVGASGETTDAALSTAFGSVLHLSTARFTARWIAYLRTQLA